jgi:hypothetical protein
MDASTRQAADLRLEEALRATGGQDPRELHRTTLRGLKQANPEGYAQAVRHYEEVVVPSIASGQADPLPAWRDYGRLLAELTSRGRTVEIDESGRARPYSPDIPLDRLVLHLPDGEARAILVSLPPRPSPAQQASWELLVQGRLRASMDA